MTVAEAADAVAALRYIDVCDPGELHRAMRIVLATRREDHALFDELFASFWTTETAGKTHPGVRIPAPVRAPAPVPPSRPSPPAHLSLERWMRPDSVRDESDPVPLRAPSDREAMRTGDFASFTGDDLEEIARVARRLARRLATRPSRRWYPHRRGSRVDLRRTIRGSLRAGGETVELALRERRVRKARLVVLCDVSGSMDLYSRFLLLFLFAMQNSFARVETFVFSTRLRRITEHLQRQPYARVLSRLAAGVHEWSGGTRIGASLAELGRDWPALVDARTVVIVLSDGWDTGDPEELSRALETLRARAGKLIWLNPLLGNPAYRPLTRGMQAALAHVDVFAPAHNLASLAALARHLSL